MKVHLNYGEKEPIIKVSNVRSVTADEALVIVPPIRTTLEYSLQFINDDELVEVTPKSLNKNLSFKNLINKSILDCFPETLPLIPSKEKIMLPFNLLSIRNFLKVSLLSMGFLILTNL